MSKFLGLRGGLPASRLIKFALGGICSGISAATRGCFDDDAPIGIGDRALLSVVVDSSCGSSMALLIVSILFFNASK